jgi:tetratricopeptide (TPR) repeat protein
VLTLAVLTTVAVLAVSNWRVTHEKDEKEKALGKALKENDRADQNLARARKAVKDSLTKIAKNRLLKEADFSELRRDLLESAVPFYVDFVKQKRDDPSLEAERGRACVELANLRQELEEAEQALADYAEGCGIWERLVADFPKNPVYRHELGNSCRVRGNLYRQLGQSARAEASCRQGLKLMEGLLAEYPAFPPYRQDLAGACNNLGLLLQGLGRLDDARLLLQKAVDLLERLAVDVPHTAEYRGNLAQSHINLAGLFQLLGRHTKALESLKRTEDISRELCDESPTKAEYREGWAAALNNKAMVFCELNRHKEGVAAHEQALRIQKKLADNFASVPTYRHDEAAFHVNLAALLSDLGHDKEALKHADDAVDILNRLLVSSSGFPKHRHLLALAHNNRGRALHGLRQYDQAREPFEKARDLLEKLVADVPGLVDSRRDLALTYNNLGELLNRLRRHDEAVAVLEKGLPLREKLVRDFPAVPSYAADLATLHLNMGIGRSARGEGEAALDWFKKGLTQVAPLLAREPRLGYARQVASRCHFARGNTLAALGRHAQALKDYDQALVFDDGQLRAMIQRNRAETLARVDGRVPPAPPPGGKVLTGALTKEDPTDTFPMTRNSHHKVHAVPFEAGQPYLIDLKGEFDTFLRIEDSQKKTVLFNDDVRPDDLNSRLVFIPPEKATYRLVVASYKAGDTGSYTLSIRKAVKVGKPTVVEDKLLDTDSKKEGYFFKTYKLPLTGGSPYTIELESRAFNTLLVLLDGAGKQGLAQNDGIAPGNKRLSRIDFTPGVDATFTVVATTSGQAETGAYRLTVQRYEAEAEAKQP